MADIIINNVNSTLDDQRYKNIYDNIKNILDRRAIPTQARMNQFDNNNFQAIKNNSNRFDIIDFNHIHQTVNLLRSLIQGKALFEDSYFINNNRRYHNNYMLISQADIDNDIIYVNSLNNITSATTSDHGCKALCAGFCSSHCYSGCNGCQGTCTGCNNTCTGSARV